MYSSPTSVSSSNGMPPVPNRFRHLPEMTVTSEDEAMNSSGSRRNSSNDEQVDSFLTILLHDYKVFCFVHKYMLQPNLEV